MLDVECWLFPRIIGSIIFPSSHLRQPRPPCLCASVATRKTVQKKLQKCIDVLAPLCESIKAHRSKSNNNTLPMKAKTLLAAAAALALGAISSQAQVYSQNIVGYVNVVCPANAYVFLANPLTTGNDVLTNVLTGVPGATTLSYWNGAGWTTYTYSALAGHWKNGAIVVDNQRLAPGVGFFLHAASQFTNTFVGACVASSGGGTATNSLATGFAPVGSPIPYGDVVTNLATFNLQVAGASTLEKWDISNQKFQPTFTYSALSHTWKQGATVTNPVINVGEGFFVSPAVPTNWVQTLQ
jgi:hypothetical protein